VEDAGGLYVELWVSLASLLRSYTAAHGLNGNRQATVELGEERILVRHHDRWLDLERNGEKVSWTRENGKSGQLEMTEAGGLRKCLPTLSASAAADSERMGHPRSEGTDPGPGEEDMDVMAEAWARELMR
jgi:hypothetical protein